ncbi:MAG: hypothetical protein PF637_00465 [Spirochaetes bacterium]|jgi:hypothetical protein|nr:hypothetical protein [Spirochaetota bacterium]
MKIECTKEEYAALAQLIYLGEFMINGVRDQENEIKQFRTLKNEFLSKADEFGFSENVVKDDNNDYDISPDYEETVMEFITEYDDECFWEELLTRLARKDLVNQFSEEELKGMAQDELLDREMLFIDKYEDEIEKNGLMNIGIIE